MPEQLTTPRLGVLTPGQQMPYLRFTSNPESPYEQLVRQVMSASSNLSTIHRGTAPSETEDLPQHTHEPPPPQPMPYPSLSAATPEVAHPTATAQRPLSRGQNPVPRRAAPVDEIPILPTRATPEEPPTDLAAKPKRRIKGIGVELEGGWNTPPPTRMHPDGSVRVSANHVGEVSSEPLTTIDAAEAWVRANYPNYVDSSCGLHVHVSVNELNYSRLMEPEFNQFFTDAMTAFVEAGLARRAPGFDRLRDRLEGKNLYCQKKFIPTEQTHRTERYGDVTSHPRYAQLNFCYTRHGTLECRLFPCFPDVNDGVAAVRKFYDTVFEYLGRFRTQREQPLTATFTVPVPSVQ